ncbi:hypothetical protein [Streptomyces sp. NPDC006552]|uniref:hypothetical protein n=1 Tax=Streptomyces sp. NPDC006552 TaxID=3157179 RepID=UPI0033AF334D
MSYVRVAGDFAESAGEHLQLALFTAGSAALLIWVGLRQRRTGRRLFAPTETMRTEDRLVPPAPVSRGRRAAGTAWIVVGSVFALPAVFNLIAAINSLVG